MIFLITRSVFHFSTFAADQAEIIRSLKEELLRAQHEAKDMRDRRDHLQRAFLEATSKRDDDAGRAAEYKVRIRELEAVIDDLRQQLLRCQPPAEDDFIGSAARPATSPTTALAPPAIAGGSNGMSHNNLAVMSSAGLGRSHGDLVASMQHEIKSLAQAQQQEGRQRADAVAKLQQTQQQLQMLWSKHLQLLAYVTGALVAGRQKMEREKRAADSSWDIVVFVIPAEMSSSDERLRALVEETQALQLDDPSSLAQMDTTLSAPVYNKYGKLCGNESGQSDC